jgi:hypothetical protein
MLAPGSPLMNSFGRLLLAVSHSAFFSTIATTSAGSPSIGSSHSHRTTLDFFLDVPAR